MDERRYRQEDEHGAGAKGPVKLLFYVLGLFLFSWVFGRPQPGGAGGDDAQQEVAGEGHYRRQVVRGWFIVCGISLAFVLYGFFALVMVGDKGPPDWDFGAIEDIPGQSVYSTYPYRGRIPTPEPQHVNQKPARVETGEAAGKVEGEKAKTEEERAGAAGQGRR